MKMPIAQGLRHALTPSGVVWSDMGQKTSTKGEVEDEHKDEGVAGDSDDCGRDNDPGRRRRS